MFALVKLGNFSVLFRADYRSEIHYAISLNLSEEQAHLEWKPYSSVSFTTVSGIQGVENSILHPTFNESVSSVNLFLLRRSVVCSSKRNHVFTYRRSYRENLFSL